tara:strand:+ start:28 stop:1698 length:1671 start_codon:yes stop_codon:yes gene_type:complete
MIIFKTIKWKNFLSTGNAFTEMQLDRNSSTLIIGDNGSGKSTLLDAITFALFNKPFRNISKPQLINTINRKKMLVEVVFNIGSKKYLIRRGSQPSIFDIEIDGVLVDQNANIRDYQRHLEENILKLNYKSFTQIVILGSASFTPFMQLTPNIRREIIEDILDIRIFTAMKAALKVKMSELKDKLRVLEGELTVTTEKANLQKKYIDTLKSDKKDRIDKIVNEIDDIESTIASLLGQVAIDTEVKNQYGDIEQNRKKLESFKLDFTRKIKEQKAALSFYADHDDCPTCKQGIPHEFKETITSEKETKLSELEEANTKLVLQWEALDKTYEEYLNLQQKIVDTNNTIMSTQTILQRLVVEKTTVENKVGNIEKENQALKEVAKEFMSKTNERTSIKEEQEYHTIADSLLKDSGIKTKIIRQYLPVINKLVNKFLKSMDFFVQFDLDETFKETIKSRHRDKFTYASFSEGEKQRIDLALVFTWRTIAKMKNSASTNLLLLDEVFDSSLDVNGTDYVMQLLNTIGDDANVFVISHKSDQLFDKFRNVVKFEKKNNYSVMK